MVQYFLISYSPYAQRYANLYLITKNCLSSFISNDYSSVPREKPPRDFFMIKTIIQCMYSWSNYILVFLSIPHSSSHDPTILKSYWAKFTAG